MPAGKYMPIFLTFFFMLMVLHGQGIQCSAFVDTTDGTKLAKNLDWILGNGMVIYNPASEEKGSITCPDKGRLWTSKYSSVTFNHLGNNMPLGGMNEAGLVVEELSTWPAEYPAENLKCLNELEWIQYQLDSFGSVGEVIKNIGTTDIEKFIFGLHYIIADKEGGSVVIEFIKGEPKIYTGADLPVPAVTNNNYDELLKYYRMYNEENLEIHDVENSQDRFVKLAQLIKTNAGNSKGINCNDMLNILNSVWVKDTRWSIVYDTERLEIQFKTDLNDSPQKICFRDFERTRQKIYSGFYHEDSLKFKKMNNEENFIYLLDLRHDILETDPDDESGMAQKIEILINGLSGKELK